MARRSPLPASLLCTAVLILCGGCFLLEEDSQPLEFPAVMVKEVEYATKPVKRGDLVDRVVMYATFVPALKRDLFFKYRGERITDIYVSEGQEVQAGQVLATLNIKSLEVLQRVRRIAVQRARVRYDMLLAMNANKFELRLAELDIESAQVQYDSVADQVAGSRLVAPFRGIVSYLYAREGDHVQPFDPVIRIVDDTNLVLQCGRGRGEHLRFGMRVDVEVGGEHFEGMVIRGPFDVEKGDDFTERLDPLVRVTDLPEDVEANDLGRVELVLQRRENVISVLKADVHAYSGRNYVFIIENGIKRERDVELGIETPTRVEITSGLAEGDLMVSR